MFLTGIETSKRTQYDLKSMFLYVSKFLSCSVRCQRCDALEFCLRHERPVLVLRAIWRQPLPDLFFFAKQWIWFWQCQVHWWAVGSSRQNASTQTSTSSRAYTPAACFCGHVGSQSPGISSWIDVVHHQNCWSELWFLLLHWFGKIQMSFPKSRVKLLER